MSVDENKKVALRWIAEYAQGNFDAAWALMHDTATWWVAGPPSFPYAGIRSKQESYDLEMEAAANVSGVADGLGMKPFGLTAEGSRVAVEVKSDAVINGVPYSNLYHFVFVVMDGQIHEIREYLDTKAAFDAFCA